MAIADPRLFAFRLVHLWKKPTIPAVNYEIPLQSSHGVLDIVRRGDWVLLVRALLTALLIGSLVANAALFFSPYKWENDKDLPRQDGAHQAGGEHQNVNTTKDRIKVHIDCEPNCA